MPRLFAISRLCWMSVLCALALVPSPAAAQETQQGQRGAAKIIRIDNNTRFDRCAAHFDSPAGFMRISWNRDHVYNISLPSQPVRGDVLIRLIDTPGGTISMNATDGGQRTSARIDSQTIEAVLRIRRRIVLSLGNRRFEYELGNASMQDIVAEVENCTHRSMGRR